jgi:redox-sensitive bicupin YhaK (pirin superfamily)
MTKTRTISETSSSVPTLEGAGVHLRRAFGFETPERYDPFLLFDDFRSDLIDHYIKGFPWHPHRGIETITYVLKGDVEHGDSLGNKGIISDGDIQWMTAGSGIIHQEMPQGDADGSMHGFQLWLNLPAEEKMCPPRYRDVKAGDIPTVELENGTTVKIICGELDKIMGPVSGISTRPEYLDVTMPPAASFSHSCHAGHTALAYVINGSGRFAPDSSKLCSNTDLIRFSDGDEISIEASTTGLRFLLFSGKPLGEPIAWRGPIVMNSEEQLQQAFREYQEGTFLKHDGSGKSL